MTLTIVNDATLDQVKEQLGRLLSDGIAHSEVRRVALNASIGMPDDPLTAIVEWLKSHTRYIPDPVGQELFISPAKMLEKIRDTGVAEGDCVSEDTEVICSDYTFRHISELNAGDTVLSYNFEARHYEFKPVTNVWYKGKLPIYEVKVRGSSSFRCTLNHKLFGWNRRFSFFEPTYPRVQVLSLAELVESKRSNGASSLLSVFQIPALSRATTRFRRDIAGKFTKQPIIANEELWLEGIYAAEGYKGGNRAFIANDNPEVRTKIINYLENLSIPCHPSKRLRHAFVTVNASEFASRLQQMGENSRDKHFLDDRMLLNRPQLKILLEGYMVGDGWQSKNPLDNRRFMYSTSSGKLAMQLQLLHWILGSPLTIQYQVNHQGAGKYPIWRLYGFKNVSAKKATNDFSGIKLPRQERTCCKLGKRSVSTIKDAGESDVFDIEVAGNHNFVSARTGIILHNCDDLALLSAAMLGSIGYTIRIALLDTDFDGELNHALTQVRSEKLGLWLNVDLSSQHPIGWEIKSGRTEYIVP